MMDLGELTELDVWHDNSGLGAAWHLDYIEIHSSANNKVRHGRLQGRAPGWGRAGLQGEAWPLCRAAG